MTDHDRGAYTPQSDAPLAFDARYSRGAGERPIPMTLIISGVILVLLLVALALFYRSGIRGSGQAPQVVGAPTTDIRSPPSDNGASASDAAAGLQVYKAEAVPPGEGRIPTTATLTAPPETPAPRPVPASPVEQADLRPALAQASPQAAATVQTSPPAAAAPTATASAPAAIIAAPALAAATPKPVKTIKVAKAIKAPLQPAVDSSAGGPMVQIGAFSSDALAQKGWSDTAVLMPTQMSGKSRKVEMASAGGKTFYRTFVGGFVTKSAADSFCASLKAAGRGCMVK